MIILYNNNNNSFGLACDSSSLSACISISWTGQTHVVLCGSCYACLVLPRTENRALCSERQFGERRQTCAKYPLLTLRRPFQKSSDTRDRLF